MLERLRPVRLAGFLGIGGMVAAAALGDERRRAAGDGRLPARAVRPHAREPDPRADLARAWPRPTFGVYWIGLGLAHAVLLRGLDHGGALVFMVLLGTFLGDTGAYLGGRAFGTRRLAPRVSPNKTWEGLGIGVLVATGVGLVRQPHLRRQLDHRHRGAAARARGGVRRADRRPLRVADQARRGYQGHRRRCSASTAARSTASTRRCSPSSRGTRYGWRVTEHRRRRPQREERKRDRQMIELLNELRVALPGVQILFAFLLTVPFTQRFPELTAFQRDTFYVTLRRAPCSRPRCLIAPSAAHRLRFHQSEREWLIESANRLMIAGLGFLAIAIGAAFLLITDVLFDGARVWIYSVLVWVGDRRAVVRAPAVASRARRVLRPVGQRGDPLALVGGDGARVALGGERRARAPRRSRARPRRPARARPRRRGSARRSRARG